MLTSPALGPTPAEQPATKPQAAKQKEATTAERAAQPVADRAPQAEAAAAPEKSVAAAPSLKAAAPETGAGVSTAPSAAVSISAREQPAPKAELKPGKRTGAAIASQKEQKAKRKPPLPVSLQASLTRKAGRSAIAIRFAGRAATQGLIVTVGSGSHRRSFRRGPKNSSPVVLSRREIGLGPVAVPILVSSLGRTRGYMLFTPTTTRLGELATRSHRARYQGEPLQKVLSDFAALTGLVILAERPLNRKVLGDVPSGPPGPALEELAAQSGLRVERQGKIIYLLTHSSPS